MERKKKTTKIIQWSVRAYSDLEKASLFYEKLYGEEKADEIIDSIVSEINNLKQGMYERGVIDENMNHLKRSYRKLVIGHIRVNYRVTKDKIYIVRFFDTRQHPNKQK